MVQEQNKKRGRNWKAKYLTKDEFWQWVGNDFKHLQDNVRTHKRLTYLLLAAVILVPFGLLYCFYQILSSLLMRSP